MVWERCVRKLRVVGEYPWGEGMNVYRWNGWRCQALWGLYGRRRWSGREKRRKNRWPWMLKRCLFAKLVSLLWICSCITINMPYIYLCQHIVHIDVYIDYAHTYTHIHMCARVYTHTHAHTSPSLFFKPITCSSLNNSITIFVSLLQAQNDLCNLTAVSFKFY